MKKAYIALGVVLFSVTVGAALIYYKKNKDSEVLCPTDVMMCPDGSSVPRTGPLCEFSVCKQETPVYMQDSNKSNDANNIEPTSLPKTNSQTKTETAPKPSKPPTTILAKITETISSTFNTSAAFIQANISSGIKNTNPTTQSNFETVQNTTPSTQNTSTINETRYNVIENYIVTPNNIIVYTLPSSSGNGLSSSSSTWETHIVNVVPVNDVAPVIGGIPAEGSVGKYYLSENSFGNIENCEFSNKIYILDTKTNTRTLLYEENSETLSSNDARACNSEIYLLATAAEKLILKYRTINTNMVCESSWSEPEKTWYLDVTNISSRTKRFVISNTLYTKAEEEEELCRNNLNKQEATSTENQN